MHTEEVLGEVYEYFEFGLCMLAWLKGHSARPYYTRPHTSFRPQLRSPGTPMSDLYDTLGHELYSKFYPNRSSRYGVNHKHPN